LLQSAHEDHEALIRYLQEHPSDVSVPYIREAIRLKPTWAHLDYDDYGSFYKKCLWALQDIGTPAALALIGERAESEIAPLRDEARYRLKQIAAGGRGGAQFQRKTDPT